MKLLSKLFLPLLPYVALGGVVYFLYDKLIPVRSKVSEFVNPTNQIDKSISSVDDIRFVTSLYDLAILLNDDLKGFSFTPRVRLFSIFNRLNKSNFKDFTLHYLDITGVTLKSALQKETSFMMNRVLVTKVKDLYSSIGEDFYTFLF